MISTRVHGPRSAHPLGLITTPPDHQGAIMRITVVDVRLAFQAYADTLNGMGVDTSKLQLQEGGATQVYRVTMDGWAAPGTSDAAFSAGYLGDTAKEAVHTLRTMIRSLTFARDYYESITPA